MELLMKATTNIFPKMKGELNTPSANVSLKAYDGSVNTQEYASCDYLYVFAFRTTELGKRRVVHAIS